MPEESYGFRLTPAQRPFGEWIGHVAMGNYNFCGVIKGGKPPDMEALHALTGKAEIVKALTEFSVGGKKLYLVQGMIGLVASGNKHYGNIVGYLRSKGVTHPCSARAAAKQ